MFRNIILVCLLLLVPSVTLASSVIRSGENVSIASDQTVEGDFYGLGNTIAVSGEVTGDLLVSGSSVTVNGKVGADLATAAGGVDVHGVVGDDARIVAGEVTIAGEVQGDLVVVAGTLKVLSTAKIAGDIIFFGTSADISGAVGKSIFGTSEKIRVDGVVLGDIDVKTAGLTLGERADVAGMVKYTSASEMVRAQNARVAGQVVKNDPIVPEVDGLREFLVPVLIVLFAALVWFLFFRKFITKVVVQTIEFPLRSFLVGFGLFFLLPIAASILVVSTLGMLLGISVFFSYLALLFIGLSLTGVVAGTYAAKLFSKTATVSITFIVIGVILVFILLFLPVLGPIALIALLFITLGALATHLYRLILLP